ncbi:MAG: 50S ribosomal protein L29 [Candidatus Altiarchaeota archaeon]
MSVLKSNEIADMGDAERGKHLAELRGELMKIRGGLASGGIPEGVGKTREIRRTIARILTIQRQEGKSGKK